MMQGDQFNSTVIRYVGNVPNNSTSSSGRKLLQSQGITVYYNLEQVLIAAANPATIFCMGWKLHSALRLEPMSNSILLTPCTSSSVASGVRPDSPHGKAAGREHAVVAAECPEPKWCAC
jgi:hypothetical protein